MKRLLTVVYLLLATMVALAQQNIRNSHKTVSPEINPDNTVTFRYVAPKAVKVCITGDFLSPEEQRQGVEMQEKEGGVWEYTSSVLQSELYYYGFIVDGRKVSDPLNTYKVRDVASVFDYFIITGGVGDLYLVQDVPHGTVMRTWYHSDMLGMDRRMVVYTPAGYESDTRKKYPVMYLLHGMGGDEEAWLSTGRAAQILDNLIAQGKAQPMIVVMTNGNTKHQAAPGESVEGMWKPYPCGSFDGSFERHFKEVLDYVDGHFRTTRKPSARAVTGLSMGGLHTYQIALNYPGTFDYIGLQSAAVGKVFGDQVPDFYKDEDAKLDALFASKPKLFYIAIGSEDFLYRQNEELRGKLDSKGYPYVYVETGEGHIWKNWRLYLTDFATRIFK